MTGYFFCIEIEFDRDFVFRQFYFSSFQFQFLFFSKKLISNRRNQKKKVAFFRKCQPTLKKRKEKKKTSKTNVEFALNEKRIKMISQNVNIVAKYSRKTNKTQESQKKGGVYNQRENFFFQIPTWSNTRNVTEIFFFEKNTDINKRDARSKKKKKNYDNLMIF